jgi:hypothetical protein
MELLVVESGAAGVVGKRPGYCPQAGLYRRNRGIEPNAGYLCVDLVKARWIMNYEFRELARRGSSDP